MKFIVSCFLITVFLCSSAYAQEIQVFERQYEALELSELERKTPESAQDDFSISRDISFDKGVSRLKNRLLNECGGIFRRGVKSAAAILAIAAICGVITSVYSAGNNERHANFILMAGALAICAACTGNVNTIIGMGERTVEEIDVFSKALLPTLGAAAAASGAPMASSAKYMATVMFADVLIGLVKNLLFPMVYAYIAVSTADAAIEGNLLGKISDLIKWLTSNLLKITLTVFITYMSVSGLLASSGDSISAKGAKLAISGIVPVVGGVIADAAETVVAGAAVMKNAIGVFGLLTIMSVCLTPFLTIAVNYFMFKISAAVIAPMVDARLSRLVDNIGGSFGIVLGISASCALLMFLSILSSMYVAGAV